MERVRLGGTHRTRRGPPDGGVGMNVGAPVDPGPAPACIVQEYGVRAPVEADPSCRPAPRREEPADGHAEAEADRTADRESGPWREEHHRRIIVGNHNIARIHGHDSNVRPAAHHDPVVARQVAGASRDASLPLHRVHHVLLLGQERVSDLGGPVHVRIHHVQHGRKWEQRLHAGIPRQLVLADGVGKRLPGKVMVLIRPLGGSGNIVGVGRRSQDLR